MLALLGASVSWAEDTATGKLRLNGRSAEIRHVWAAIDDERLDGDKLFLLLSDRVIESFESFHRAMEASEINGIKVTLDPISLEPTGVYYVIHEDAGTASLWDPVVVTVEKIGKRRYRGSFQTQGHEVEAGTVDLDVSFETELSRYSPCVQVGEDCVRTKKALGDASRKEKKALLSERERLMKEMEALEGQRPPPL